MQSILGYRAKETSIVLDGVTVRLVRAEGLEEFVDADALLRESEAPEPPYWMHLWPAAATLASAAGRSPRIGPGVRVIELGSGLSLPGLMAALRGATVVVTDWKREPLVFAAASAALNGCELSAVQMDWSTPAFQRVFDLCLGADVAYDANAEAFLVRAMGELLRPGGSAWLADSVNTHRPSLAERLCEAGFGVTLTHAEERDEERPVWVRLLEVTVPGGESAR